MISPNGRPLRSARLSSASKRSSKPRRLRQPVSGSARDTRASASRRRSWLRACQPHSTAVQPRQSAKKPTYSGSGPVPGDPHRHVGDVVERRDRDHRGERVRERREDHRDEEQQRERAGRPAVGSHDDGGERDLGDAPQQEERLAPAAAHDALVRDQHEQQRHDRPEAEQRGDQLAVRAGPRWRPRRASRRRRSRASGARRRRCSRRARAAPGSRRPPTRPAMPYERIGGFRGAP